MDSVSQRHCSSLVLKWSLVIMRAELTHVTSKETKKRSATLVYPNAALLASMAARLFCAAMVECTLGVVGGGASDLGLSGADPIVTEYWS